ncbi:MAG TPA: D-aminoacylase [Acidobacteriota bacterium]|nr:D-aminoacylase [Acidobacteriota bacterium]
MGQGSVDLIIENGRLLDGSGNPWRYADVGVRDGIIVAVGDLEDVEAERRIDASGLYVAPGFIDVHSHAAGPLENPDLASAEPLLRQGITTIVGNPDGGGPVDLAAQGRRLETVHPGVNVALLAPHGSIRRKVMGIQDRAPSAPEMEQMKDLVEAAMKDGGWGLSSGLYYTPGRFAETEEVIDLARVAAAHGGLYTSHIRDEADYNIGLVAAVDEVIEISRQAGIPAVVTHVKALGPRVWGFSEAVVQRVESARSEGLEVWADQYPYQASATGLGAALLPGVNLETAQLSDEELRKIIGLNLQRRGGADRIQFRFSTSQPEIEGRTLAEVARGRSLAPDQTALDLLRGGGAGIVSFNMHPADVARFMSQEWVMTCSDGGLVPAGRGVPHPRNNGTFPRKIRRYVLENGVISLPFAIRSMTSLPASVFGFHDRGRLVPGMVADIVVFDLERLTDRATFQDPHQLSQGIVHVLLAGRLALDNESLTSQRLGSVLRK